jgi:SAM-dependent methyltransferase
MINEEWVWSQTNQALKHHNDVEHACQALSREEFPLHPDRNKNWDNYLAIKHTMLRSSLHEPVLDAGAGDESAFLPGLCEHGFTNLVGINLDRKDDYKAGIREGIRYAYGDITSTPFPSRIFGAIACLSVIEHGVDWKAFLFEMYRILKDDARLFLSFDYWPDKIDTTGLVTHDAAINIFSEAEVFELLDFAEKVGFRLVGSGPDTTVSEPIIFWAGRSYTFMNLLLRKDI